MLDPDRFRSWPAASTRSGDTQDVLSVSRFSHARNRSSGSSVSASSMAKARTGGLVLRKTFIDVDVSDRASSLSPRASSDPGSESSRGMFFQGEQCYIEGLSERFGFGEEEERETSNIVDSVELRSQLQATTRNLTKSLRVKGHREALTVIHELPEQVGDMILETGTRMVDSVNSEVAAMQTIIEGDTMQQRDHVTQGLQAIPDMVKNSFEASAAKAKGIVRNHVAGLVGMERGEFVDEMRKIPDQLQQIAERAMQHAVENSQEQAEQQLDAVLFTIQEESAELRNAKMRVLSCVVPSADAPSALVADTVEQAVAAVQEKEVLENAIANRLIADTLLRAKVGQNVSESITQAAVNPGSIGHPDLCPRPCLYFAAGKCSNGMSCDFCHMPHERRPAHLDKRHRNMLQKIPFEQRVLLVLPLLRQKVANLGVVIDAGTSLGFLEEIARQAACSAQSAQSTTAGKQHRSLVIAMQNMSLRALLTCLHRSAVVQHPAYCKDIHALIRQLRTQSFAGVGAEAAACDKGSEGMSFDGDESP